MFRNRFALLFATLACLSTSFARSTPLQVHVQDGSGEALRDQLVIVKLLEKYGEVFRVLTDESRNIPVRDLSPGYYRLIVTDPYGLWETKIQEFAISSEPANLVVSLPPMPTHGLGDRVLVGGEAPRKLKVQFTDAKGDAIPAVNFLVRNEDLDFASWHVADAKGAETVELPDQPITLVALWNGRLVTKTFDNRFVDELHGKTLVIRID